MNAERRTAPSPRWALRAAGFAAATFLGGICAAQASAAGRAEIQINLCSDPAQAVRALDLRPKADAPTRVWFFDTRALTLYDRGLRLRLRQTGGTRSELTLKAGGHDCGRVAPGLLKRHDKCEADLHGDRLDDTLSLTRMLDGHQQERLLAPGAAAGQALSAALDPVLAKRQRELLGGQAGAPDGAALPPELVRLGPATVRAYERRGEDVVVEVWTLPAGQQFVEISQKVERDAALPGRARLLERVRSAGLAPCADQDSQARNKLRLMAG